MIAYCINLPERKDKLELANKEFKKLPFNVLTFNAIKRSPGWEGCRLSHLTVLQHAREIYPGEVFTVFEDDVKFMINHPWDKVQEAMRELPKDWDVLYLGATLQEDLLRYSKNLYRLTKGWTTHAMIFNPAGGVVDYILEHNGGGRKIDVFYANVIQQKFKCYITYPMIANQRDGYSDILNKHVNNGQIINDYYKRHTRQ